MSINRRDFLKFSAIAAALTATPRIIKAQSPPKVVIIGGGFAGSTVARYLSMWSQQTLDIQLIDPSDAHISCVLSNLVLNGRISLGQLALEHASLNKLGIEVIKNQVMSINHGGSYVVLKSGDTLVYDTLIIATGVDFKPLTNLNVDITPHAWIAGEQTTLLANKINALSSGATFIMTVPKAPYRCPPGPYERACLVADIFQRNGLDNGGGKVIVLDENANIQAERHTFERAFNELYGDVIEYIPNMIIEDVESLGGNVVTASQTFNGDLINVIPRHQASPIIRNAGLTGLGDWALVDPLTYESTLAEFAGIYVIGDSQNTNQPKSAHMANAQAKICADAIIRTFTGLSNYDQERIENVTTNSACYSPITFDEASWLSANYAYDQITQQMQATHIGEAENWSKDNYKQMFDWANNLFNDSFGNTL